MSKNPYIIDEAAGLTSLRDPMILVVGDTYYLTGTQNPIWKGPNEGVRLWSSKDLVHFTNHGLLVAREDMPEDMWCRDRFWAPELFDGGDGWFYLTFNCRNEDARYQHFHSVGLARSRNVTGPYEILTVERSLAEDVEGGNDSTLFRDDDGTLYVGFNSRGANPATHLLLYKLDVNDLSLHDRVEVCEKGKEGEWDAIGVEGQCIVKRHGIYFQWYSSWTTTYSAGILVADSMAGPWKKSKQNPVLVGNEEWHRSGHNHSFRGLDGKDYITFHAFMSDKNEEALPRIFIRQVEYLPDGTVKVFA